jgi:hypothetical protein
MEVVWHNPCSLIYAEEEVRTFEAALKNGMGTDYPSPFPIRHPQSWAVLPGLQAFQLTKHYPSNKKSTLVNFINFISA